MINRRPANFVAIPEIAKAYENDPRTQMAMAALAQGSSTSPVAQGKYAVADGIARMIQGLAGGVMAKKGLKMAMGDQADLLALREQRGQEGLTGLDLAQKAAGALGAPAPGATPPVPPQAPPVAPVDATQPALQLASAQRPATGGPGGAMRPFPQRTGGGASSNLVRSKSYKDPGYDALESQMEHKYNLPQGVLRNLRTKGERSNADQVSEAGARSVYQFIPSTRQAFIKKYGVDAWAGPAQAAEAAALHVRESLDRNGGDVGAAVGEYHGGPDRSKWGKRTRAYVARVTGQQGGTIPSDPSGAARELLPVPDAPERAVRPDAPEAVPATESDTLRAAYRMMVDGNAYESANAQDMYKTGLGEQSRFKETFAERRQKIIDDQAGMDRQVYADSERSYRDNQYQDRRDIRQRNWGVEDTEDQQKYGTSERVAGQAFQSTEAAKERTFRAAEAEKDRQAQQQILAQESQFRSEEARIKSEEKRQNWLNTEPGRKEFKSYRERSTAAGGALDALDRMDEILNDGYRTGGAITGNAPSFTRWNSEKQQEFESLSNALALSNVENMKGALSDKDVQFVQSMTPSVQKLSKTNRNRIKYLRNTFKRVQEYELEQIRSQADGRQLEFSEEWNRFRNSVSVGSGISFKEWKAAPRYDRKGRRIN